MATLREEVMAQMVLSRLSEDTRTCGQTIDVSVVDEEILLIGSCDSDDQKAVAEMLALGTYGVRKVTDMLRVRRLKQSI